MRSGITAATLLFSDGSSLDTGILPNDGSPLTLDFPEQWDRYLRLRVFNGDDRPVPIERALFETIGRRVKFLPDAAGEYALYYGNPEAKAPSYDLGAVLARRTQAAEIVLAAGAERRNAAYRPPQKPWSDRYPALLYSVLAAAIVSMGYVAVRFLGALKGGASRP